MRYNLKEKGLKCGYRTWKFRINLNMGMGTHINSLYKSGDKLSNRTVATFNELHLLK